MTCEEMKHQYHGEDIRIDQYLVKLYPHISRSYLQQTIEKGSVLVNGKACRKGTLLHKGDEVDVQPFTEPKDRMIEPNMAVHFKVLHQYEHYLVLEKPPYLPTHPNQFDDRNTLANGLVARFPQMMGVGEDALRPGIVHRLDTNTSGVMLAALTQEGFEKIRSLFNERKIHKTYAALVLGHVDFAGSVESDIAHHAKNPRKMVAVTTKNVPFRSRKRQAKTLFEPWQSFEHYSLVKVQTLTGRMHQVRVHMASIGNPLAGDEMYQSPKEKNKDKLGLTRHFLHAITIEFEDPWTGEKRTFRSDLSPDLEFVLKSLESTQPAA